MILRCPPLGRLAVLLVAAAVPLSACSGGSSTPHVANLARNTTNPTTDGSGGSATPAPSGDPTTLVDQWATCIRHHGDPDQTDPTIDAHGVINIIGPLAGPGVPRIAGGPETATGVCSQYLAAAQRLLRAAMPVAPPPTQAELIKYVGCMRANGVPNYPYPTGDKSNFNEAGVDPNSPLFEKADRVCGQQIGAPAWWTNGWGPPGDISVGPPSSVLPRSASVPTGGSGSGANG